MSDQVVDMQWCTNRTAQIILLPPTEGFYNNVNIQNFSQRNKLACNGKSLYSWQEEPSA